MSDLITNIASLFKHVGVDDFASLEKSIYKGTDCGAWICKLAGLNHGDPDGVEVGSIVEGSEACATPVKLHYPFDSKALWEALDGIEAECSELWDEANEDEA